MKKYLETYYRGIINGLGFLTVIGITGIAYGAYVSMIDVNNGETLTASTFNIVQENIRTLKTTVDGHTTSISTLSSGNVPAGFVGAFNLASCPSGWIAADGTSGTPDLRGTFIRGMNGSVNGRDVSRTLGSYQVDELKSHNHTYPYSNANLSNGTTNVSGNNGTTLGSLTFSSAGGTETRPKNVALLYCVKQ